MDSHSDAHHAFQQQDFNEDNNLDYVEVGIDGITL